ncbi:MAG: TrbI/VirB10 family protein [Bdellovibrionales bacterium]|nr:TrbI/VirB10 family protein [Bdellovibrionales bacterium]
MEALKRIVFKESVPFSKKRDLNGAGIAKLAAVVIGTLMLGLLVMPSSDPKATNFQEQVDAQGTVRTKPKDLDPTDQTIEEMKASQASLRNAPRVGAFPSGAGIGASGGGSNGGDRNVSMIISRSGSDTRNTLLIGTRVPIQLAQSLTISNQTMPVTGYVLGDVMGEGSLAIPEGSRAIGDATFDAENGRANLTWKTIILPDGRERAFSAVSVGRDNQVGIEGRVKSDAMKNTVGQTITGFIGAFAAGSITSGMLGASEGGLSNGLKNAVAQTAKDRANDFGEGLKKEHSWIELVAGTPMTAILSQAFVFRDPGAANGQ